jgi:hypothetical protein
MSTLIIKDLAASKELDKAAAMKICGGLINTNALFQARFLDDPQPSGALLPPSIYNIITNNYNLYQNPTIFNVFNSVRNNNSNSGNLSFSTLSVNAASPLATANPALIGV